MKVLHHFSIIIAVLVLLMLPPPSLARTTKNHNNKRRFAGGGGAFKMPQEDPYKVLGIKFRDRNNLEAIKKAYRQKAKDSHPDKNPDMDPNKAADNFRRIVDAWELLSNPRNKKIYDTNLHKKNRNAGQQQRMYTTTTRTTTKKKQGTMGGSYQHFTFNQKTYGTHNNHNRKQQHQQQQNKQQHYQQQAKRAQILKDAKVAQESVWRLSSLEQLYQSQLLDHNKRFTKHFFCVFVSGKKIEQFVDNDLLFPYPFGSNGRNGMNWESILQTAKVRYNSPTPLTQMFRVPTHQRSASKSDKPYIIFAKKGNSIHQFKVYQPKDTIVKHLHEHLEDWVLKQLTTMVTIVNHHHAPIKVFIKDDIDGVQSMGKPIAPGYQTTIQSLLGDRVVILDSNIDQFPGSGQGWKPNLLQNDVILEAVSLTNVLITKASQVIEVGLTHGGSTISRRCYDLSLQCPSWATQFTLLSHAKKVSNCQAQVEFAHSMCPYSCGVCIESQWNGIYYGLFHLPLYKVPTPILRGTLSGLRSTARFFKTFLHDLNHLFSMRRNVTVLFIVAGFLVGIQIVILGQMLTTTGTGTSTTNHHHHPASSPSSLGLILLLASCMMGWGIWMSHATSHQVPTILRGFHNDLLQMTKYSMDVVYGLVYLGFLSLVLSKKLVQRVAQRHQQRSQVNVGPGPRRPQSSSSNRPVFFLCVLVTMSTLMITGTSCVLRNDILVSGKKNHRYLRWTSIWQLRKNVALCILVWGGLLGAIVLNLGRFVMQISKKYWGLSILNASLLCFGIGLALKDAFFFKDLDHVLNFRMSAAIPCATLGMMWGVGVAHFLSTYQVKLKVD